METLWRGWQEYRGEGRLNAYMDDSVGERGRTLGEIPSNDFKFPLHRGAWLRYRLLFCLPQLGAQNPQWGSKGLNSVPL